MSINWTAVNIIASIMSLISICGASVVIYSAHEKRTKDKENRYFLVNDYVFWMSWCDLVTHIITLIYWMTSISTPSPDSNPIYDISSTLCGFFGFIFQFALISSATWSFSIAINLFRLLRGTAIFDLMQNPDDIIKRNHVLIWTVSIICTLIPITKYGITENPDGKYECWIKDENPNWTMSLYLPILLYISITILILFWILLSKCNVIQTMNYRGASKSPQNCLAAYSFLFVFIWLFPTIGRYAKIIRGDQPQILLALHHILLSSVGAGNWIIWTYIYPMEDSEEFGQTSFDVLIDHHDQQSDVFSVGDVNSNC